MDMDKIRVETSRGVPPCSPVLLFSCSPILFSDDVCGKDDRTIWPPGKATKASGLVASDKGKPEVCAMCMAPEGIGDRGSRKWADPRRRTDDDGAGNANFHRAFLRSILPRA